jgi:hypothetical protein
MIYQPPCGDPLHVRNLQSLGHCPTCVDKIENEMALPFVLADESGNVRLVADKTTTILTKAQARMLAEKLLARAQA